MSSGSESKLVAYYSSIQCHARRGGGGQIFLLVCINFIPIKLTRPQTTDQTQLDAVRETVRDARELF